MTNKSAHSISNFQAALFALSLDREAATPLHVQLAEALRDMIQQGKAAPGARLPASRMLAAELSISRITVLTAVDQLIAEGYLETRRGAGTYVVDDLPDMPALPPEQLKTPPAPPPPPLRPFQPALPDLESFPHVEWARHLERTWRYPHPALTGVPDPMGWMPLRAQIAAHLSVWRGIQARPEQVIITSGATEGFELITRAFLAAGDPVMIEDPCFAPMRAALIRAGMKVRACPVDVEGLDIANAPTEGAKLAVLTPSRQYPTGATLPLARRAAALEWASQSNAWIIEDDYDGEFRYRGQPLPALASLDRAGRVFYLGSFSKLLSPALRLGYLVAPEHTLPGLFRAMAETGARASVVPQPALAGFMESGGFSTHLRRMRRTYAKRQEVLRNALAGHEDWIIAHAEDAGMHLCCTLGPRMKGVHDTVIAAAGAKVGLTLRALSAYSTQPEPRQGLVLGYTAFAPEVLEEGAKTLIAMLQKLGR